MANYYVATTGSNASAGTSPQAPWATIAYAVTQVTAGDTIYLMPGTYYEVGIRPTVSGTSGNRITITSYDRNNRAHVRGTTDTAAFVFRNVSYWTLSYVVMGGTSSSDIASMGGVVIGGYQNTGGVAHTANTSYITIDNCEIKWNSTKHPILINSTSTSYGVRYARITNNYIHDTTGDPTKYNETITQAGNVAYTLIEKNRLVNVAYIGIDAIGYDNTDDDYPNLQPNHYVVRGNYINYVRTATASPGIGIKNDGGGTHILIENNTVLLAPGCVTGAEPFHDNNLTNLKYIIVRNNVFDATNSGYGLSWGMGTNGMSADTHYNYVAKMSDSVAVHNVIRASTYGIMLFRAEDTAIKNNVVVNTGAHALTQSDTLTRDAALTTTGNSINGNVYYSSNGGQVFRWYGGAWYTSFTAWKSGTGQDANSLYASPIFTNTADLDYTLTSASPGNGAAIALTTTTNSGSGATSMTVANADYFCDGYGLVGGDIINVGGTQMTITAVNYTTNTLTLATPATWSNGANVHYVYNGTAPSMGLTSSVSSGEIIEIPDEEDGGGDSGGDNGGGSGNTTRYTVQVGGTSSNCYRRESDSGFDTTDLLFSGDYTSESYDYTAGMRFALPLDIDPGRIGTAYLKLNASFVVGSSWPLRIYSEQTDNSDAFSDATDFDARTRTTAYVDWSPSVSVGGAYTSPDITSILQELADDYGGLSSGDYVTLFVTSQTAGFGNFGLVGWTDYDTSPTGAPTLEINYTNAAANNGAVTLQVAHSYDDTSGSNANYYPTSTTGFIGDNTSGDYDYTTGCRFILSEAIPATATITNAYLTLKSAGYVTAIPAMQIKGEDTATSARFTDKANFDGRTRTTASVNWTPGAWVTGTDYNSPDLSSIVQELVTDNGGLAMGAGITMFVGTQAAGWGGSQALAYAYTYDNTPSFAPKLIIEWETPGNSRGYATGYTTGLRIGIGI